MKSFLYQTHHILLDYNAAVFSFILAALCGPVLYHALYCVAYLMLLLVHLRLNTRYCS